MNEIKKKRRIGVIGRPRITAKAYYFKADKDLINVLDSQENRNRFINNAVREKSERDKLI